MDRNYIRDEHLIERYLSGELTMREAREFEQYCTDHPEVLKELPIPVRIKARLARRPLPESETGMFPAIPSGTTRAAIDAEKDGFDPDEEREHSRTRSGSASGLVAIALGITLLLAVAAAISQAMKANSLTTQLNELRRERQSLQLQAPGNVQTYRLQPSKEKPQAASATIGWPVPPQWMELHVDVAQGKYTQFQVTIDKVDEGRVMQMRRLARDSNKELRLALNSSAFGPGEYLLKIDGYTWRGQLEDLGWLRLDLQ